jgi:hypothetical protein
MTTSQTTAAMLAGIRLDMLLTNEQIAAIDDVAMTAEFDQAAWNETHGTDEMNNLIYMAFKLNALLETLEPATT